MTDQDNQDETDSQDAQATPGVPETGDMTAPPQDLQVAVGCPACGVSVDYAKHFADAPDRLECLACGTEYSREEAQ